LGQSRSFFIDIIHHFRSRVFIGKHWILATGKNRPGKGIHHPHLGSRCFTFDDNSPFGGVGSHFVEFHRRFFPIFQLRTRDINQVAEQYYKGLVQATKKNMERMAEAVPDSNDQAFQHFLTNSPWDEQLVVEQVAHDANELLGGGGNSCLLLDESGMPKKGDKSVGVSRQWCGQLGKTDNCQVGVYSILCHGKNYAPIGFRLFLPQIWVDDKARCKEAGIPDESIEFFTKPELAIQLVIEARMHGVEFEWISTDSLYGKDAAFLRILDQMDEIFMADVAKNQRIYLEDPNPLVPPPNSKRGPNPSKLKAQCEPIRVDKWAEQQPATRWKKTRVRNTTKGKLQVKILHRSWIGF
jgi:SRSO17 transposase